jgi:hypothetical protein
MANFNWTCPYCQKAQTVTDPNYHTHDWNMAVGKIAEGDVGVRLTAIGCLNAECQKLTLTAALLKVSNQGYLISAEQKGFWRLRPESSAKPQPDYIPQALRDDYLEACRIRDLSPKASATLARRCLQGMIRDFAGIAKGTLDAEIRELQARVDADNAPRGVTHESVEAIDHVRKIGNIGAHMEKDIGMIIDIEPQEAQMLIELIETLFDEWYVAREHRAVRLAAIAALRASKDSAKGS